MKNVFVLFLYMFLCSEVFAQNNYCKDKTVDPKVDSLFKLNFTAIDKVVKSKHTLSRDENIFLYLLSFISGIGKEMHSYTGEFKKITKKDLKKWSKWYVNHKCKISWENHIVKGKQIIESFPMAKNLDEIERYEKELSLLKIQ